MVRVELKVYPSRFASVSYLNGELVSSEGDQKGGGGGNLMLW